MESFNFRDIRVEKANAISRYNRIERITTLFRVVELLIFLIIFSKFSNHFAFSLKISSDYLKGISITLISPRFVFLLGNAIVVVLFLKSGIFSSNNNGEKGSDLYEEYVEKCRKNMQTPCNNKCENKASYNNRHCHDEKRIERSRSEKLDRAAPREDDRRRRVLLRSMTEGCRKIVEKPAITNKCEEEMSSEEFRRTVEAFIARQRRFLREG